MDYQDTEEVIQTYLEAVDTGREEGLAVELEMLVDDVLNSSDLDRLKETTQMNFPDKKPQSKE